MPDENRETHNPKEPEGLGEHARRREAEIAHDQGWDLNEDERKQQPRGRPAHYGGKGYDYGAQDFGDTPEKRDNPEGASDETEQRRKAG
jgi:hypothetical protein